jgi:phosphohistidine phosphatase
MMSDPFELVLLRHAHAEPAAPGQLDQDRALCARGNEEARAAAEWLASQPKPARIVCSPSRRTRETAAAVNERLGLEVVTDARIYEAELRDLLDVIESHRDAGRVLLVGHNPGFEGLVALLTTGQSGDHRGMPPAGIAWLGFDADAPLEPGTGRLTAFCSP